MELILGRGAEGLPNRPGERKWDGLSAVHRLATDGLTGVQPRTQADDDANCDLSTTFGVLTLDYAEYKKNIIII